MQVKVHNDNRYPFEQKIAEVTYKIPAGGFIEMDEEEADRLVKAYSPIAVDYDGNAMPQSYKMIRIDEQDLAKARNMRAAKTKTGGFFCQACGYVAGNKWELMGHIQDMHSQQWDDPEEASKEIAKENKKKA